LEFPKILELLAAQAAFSLGKERCLRLRPSTDERWIATRLAETTQARRLLTEQGAPPFGGITDVGDPLARARVGAVLAPEGWAEADRERFAKETPLARIGTPDDVVAAIRYLIGAAYVTGETLFVDGGRHGAR